MIWYLSGSTLFPTNNLHYTTFFQANHSINHRNRLYFISVFIYTSIKVNLTKGGKEMASPEPIRTIYNPQIEMFAHFKTKSSFHKTKRII